MKLIKNSYKNLENRVERATARIAGIAWRDVNFGGAKALVFLNRLKALKSPNVYEYESAVNAAYSSQDGTAAAFTPWECPECSQTYLGQDKAIQCCAESDENLLFLDELETESEDGEIQELAKVSSDELYDHVPGDIYPWE